MCVDYTTKGVTNLVENILTVCHSKLKEKLNERDIDCTNIPLDEVFHGDHCEPFRGLNSAYQQKQKNRLVYVVIKFCIKCML